MGPCLVHILKFFVSGLEVQSFGFNELCGFWRPEGQLVRLFLSEAGFEKVSSEQAVL